MTSVAFNPSVLTGFLKNGIKMMNIYHL